MTTLDVVATKKKSDEDGRSAEAAAAAELVRLAREQGLSLTGPDGLLKLFTKNVLEAALNEELTEHLGHEKHRDVEDREGTNVRNGTRSKTVLTEASGHVQIEVPRDRDGTFEPQIVKKRQRRLNGVEEIVLSLYAKGLTTGEISAHFEQIYGASVSKETVVCDGLKGLPEVVGNVWPLATVQTCVIHLLRNTFRLASKQDWDALKRDVKPIHTAPSPAAARVALDDLTEKWGTKYGAIIRLWESAWEEFTPFLAYDLEIRTVICSMNAIESLNARYRRGVRARGHFPTEQAALKCLGVPPLMLQRGRSCHS